MRVVRYVSAIKQTNTIRFNSASYQFCVVYFETDENKRIFLEKKMLGQEMFSTSVKVLEIASLIFYRRLRQLVEVKI